MWNGYDITFMGELKRSSYVDIVYEDTKLGEAIYLRVLGLDVLWHSF